MLGLIKKDFLIIKANLKSMVITFIVYLMLAFQGTFDVTFIIPIIGIMLFMLLYIGIRMAFTTVAEKKADYKKSLEDQYK